MMNQKNLEATAQITIFIVLCLLWVMTVLVSLSITIDAGNHRVASEVKTTFCAFNMLVCLISQVVLIFSTNWKAKFLFALCALWTISNQPACFENGILQAGEVRAQMSLKVKDDNQQIDAVHSTIEKIANLSVNENNISPSSENKIKMKQLDILNKLVDKSNELGDAHQEDTLSARSDGAIKSLSSITTISEENLTYLTTLLPSILLELIGPFLCYQIHLRRNNFFASVVQFYGKHEHDLTPNLKINTTSEKDLPKVTEIQELFKCRRNIACQIRHAAIDLIENKPMKI